MEVLSFNLSLMEQYRVSFRVFPQERSPRPLAESPPGRLRAPELYSRFAFAGSFGFGLLYLFFMCSRDPHVDEYRSSTLGRSQVILTTRRMTSQVQSSSCGRFDPCGSECASPYQLEHVHRIRGDQKSPSQQLSSLNCDYDGVTSDIRLLNGEPQREPRRHPRRQAYI